MIWYAIASLTPAALLALACLWGDVWAVLAVLSITVVVFFADKLPKVIGAAQSDGRALSVTLAALHIVLLGVGVWALGASAHLDVLDKLLIFTGLGLFFGQISNSNAHELIHAQGRRRRGLGALVYISLLHGHHVSAHLRVHHIFAATPKDPNSARAGEHFWAFVCRALTGEFVAGLEAERAHRARSTAHLPIWTHPYLWYVLGGVGTLIAAYLIAGGKGVIAYLGLVFYAQMQLLLSDYVQHYGLQRAVTADGKPAPMGPEHSWNAPKWYSSAMMLNAPRHSDHHMRPAKPFPALEVDRKAMPLLPHSLPVMAVLALIPPVWHRVMDHRVKRWQNPA